MVTIEDNFSITNLFISKKLKITIADDRNTTYNIFLKAPSVKETQQEEFLLTSVYFWGMSGPQLERTFKVEKLSSLDFLKFVFANGYFQELWDLKQNFKKALDFFFDKKWELKEDSQLFINDILITDQIWNYLIYVIKLIQGEKVAKPIDLNSLTPQERAWMEAQQKMQERINSIKRESENNDENADEDVLMKVILTITYAFPGLKIDYLLNQTMAQIHWLQKYAAGSVSYDFSSKVMAAGNMKKGSKLEFFIK